jgi:hypothetical protein
MRTARRLLRLTAQSALLVVAVAAASARAQPHDRVLDGSSPAKLETSVARLQNDLEGRRREELDVALAMIWMNRTANSGDGDSELDVDDVRQLEIDATALLTEIRRGNLVSAIEEREAADGDYTAADYFAQLHGLGYDEILSLAGRPTESGYLDAVREASQQLRCLSQGPAFTQGSASQAARRRNSYCVPRTIQPYAGRELATASAAMNEGRYADARATMAELRLGRLSPYERSLTEQFLYSLSEAEGNPAAAREHLLNALAARGLNPNETRQVLDRIRALDARLSVEPQ